MQVCGGVFHHLLILAGAAVYSSELLLNGIVTQKLEYERWYYRFIIIIIIDFESYKLRKN